MTLQKSLKEGLGPASSATILGLKVVGGKLLPGNHIGAVIEKVKKGSLADTVGRLLPGWDSRDVMTPAERKIEGILLFSPLQATRSWSGTAAP